jgi:transcriptional regulator with XRE-family HTH domain
MRRIARTLLAWRTESGQTLADVAKAVGWSVSKQSRLETVKLPVMPADVMTLALHFGRSPEEREALFRDAQTAQSPRWLDQISADAFAADVREYVSLEAEAGEVRIFKIDVVPGLFQTMDYARAIETASLSVGGEGNGNVLEDRVRARIQRQARLRDEVPLRGRAVLAEAVLRIQVGGTAVWRGQLQKIAELMALPNLDIRFLRSENGAYAAMGYPFNILSFDDDEPDVGYIELLGKGVYLEQEPEVRPYVQAFDELWESAASPEESSDLLAGIVAEIR